jgi:hypothetical protein
MNSNDNTISIETSDCNDIDNNYNAIIIAIPSFGNTVSASFSITVTYDCSAIIVTNGGDVSFNYTIQDASKDFKLGFTSTSPLCNWSCNLTTTCTNSDSSAIDSNIFTVKSN